VNRLTHCFYRKSGRGVNPKRGELTSDNRALGRGYALHRQRGRARAAGYERTSMARQQPTFQNQPVPGAIEHPAHGGATHPKASFDQEAEMKSWKAA